MYISIYIHVYVYLDTACPLGHHYNEFVAFGALGYTHTWVCLSPKWTSCHKDVSVMIGKTYCIKIMHIYYAHPSLL